jgi:hypothetical protein
MMTARTEADYTGLIISQHADKPNFAATVGIAVEPFCGLQSMETTAITATTIDTARGVQLDWIGQWVGIGRRVPVPIAGVYFSWNTTVAEGWNSGVWKGEFDPTTGLTDLPDADYRVLIKAKILANNSSGSIPEIYAILDAAFPGVVIDVIDNQDMTMEVLYTIADFTPIKEAILIQGLIPIKPAGVSITYTGS